MVLDQNRETADQLWGCLEWLRSTLPAAESTDWFIVNDSLGLEPPVLPLPWLSSVKDFGERDHLINLLDSLDHQPSFRLLCRAFDVIARREVNESEAYHDTERRGQVSLDQRVMSSLAFMVGNRIALAEYMGGGRIALAETEELASAPIIIWLKKAFLRYWDGQCVLENDSIAYATLRILSTATHHTFHEYIDKTPDIELYHYFYGISARLDIAEMARSYLEQINQQTKFHLLAFPILFTASELATYFRAINHLRMRKAHTEAEIASNMRMRYDHLDVSDNADNNHIVGQLKWQEDHYLLLNISRQNVVRDAFDQLWQRRKTELLRPLRIRLGEANEFEIGHDLGGVQIEFFNLLWRELLKEETGMFNSDASTGLSYFRPASLQPLYMFELCGMLFSLALYNGITMPVHFPLAFYFQLLNPPGFVVPVIEDGWPEVARSLQSILDNDIPGLEAVLPLEANGMRFSILADQVCGSYHDPRADTDRIALQVVEASKIVHHENKDTQPSTNASTNLSSTSDAIEVDLKTIQDSIPGFRLFPATTKPTEVTPSFKALYVAIYADWLTTISVEPQLKAFKRGFHTILPEHTTAFLSAPQLRSIAEGSTSFSLEDLQAATTYEGFDPSSRYIKNFWRILSTWPEEKQKQLLKFVTAVERLPAGGAKNFGFKIERARHNEVDGEEVKDKEEKLPTSSTCFRTLFLPKYSSSEVLEKKLSLALEFGSEGFGTG